MRARANKGTGSKHRVNSRKSTTVHTYATSGIFILGFIYSQDCTKKAKEALDVDVSCE